jgi:diadenylate cyclase
MIPPIVATLRWQNIVDFVVLTVAIYLFLRWGKDARAFRVSLAIVALRACALLASQLDLVITGLILDATNLIAVILFLIVYQSELRHALTRLDVMAWLVPHHKSAVARSLDAISAAAFTLAEIGCGALIVVLRQDAINELIDGGINLDGEISAEILESIFRKSSPVHDGAVIIDGDRIARVAAILPLTHRTDLLSQYGTRHRAAIGLAERCDALVVVVSEERREVTLMAGHDILRMPSAQALRAKIQELQAPLQPDSKTKLRSIFFGDFGLKSASLALAFLFWSISFFLVGNSIRTVTVPIEFTNVPDNMEISRLSTDTVQVQLRGSAWVLDSVSLNTLVMRFDLAGVKEGTHALSEEQSTLSLPPGLVIENVSPHNISLNLEHAGQP